VSVKNREDLIAEIVAQIQANGAQAITGPIVNQLLQDLADSSVNMLGDTTIQGKLAYSSLFSIVNPGDIVYKSWVENNIVFTTLAKLDDNGVLRSIKIDASGNLYTEII
jgi:hypothetical protein